MSFTILFLKKKTLALGLDGNFYKNFGKFKKKWALSNPTTSNELKEQFLIYLDYFHSVVIIHRCTALSSGSKDLKTCFMFEARYLNVSFHM